MEKYTHAIVKKLSHHGYISQDSESVYEYGIELILYNLLSTLSLLIIAHIFSYLFEALILISIFYFNQSFGGGYHADTHFKCFIMMVIYEVLFFLSFHLTIPRFCHFIMCVLSCCVMFIYPLSLHENKRYLAYKSKVWTVRNRILIGLQLTTSCILVFNNHININVVYATSIALVYSAMSRFCSIKTD